MKAQVTVIPDDNYISVEGSGLFFEFDAPETMHALQWKNGQGHMEFKDGRRNLPLAARDYQGRVEPFVLAWAEEKARLELEAARGEDA